MNIYRQTIRKAIELAALGALGGCAGPTTPLGAVWSVTPQIGAPDADQAASPTEVAQAGQTADLAPRIQFTPSRQVLHGPAAMKVMIQDFSGDLKNYRLRVRYNGADVSQTFLRQSTVTLHREEGKIIIENPVVRLPPTTENRIELTYRNSRGVRAYARYEAPLCHAFRPAPVLSVGPFKPSPSLIAMIERLSQQEGFNPAFFTALIAQESSFNPGVVSWAKALGLTQVTSVAESEVIEDHSDWPRYPGINQMSSVRVKLLVDSGRINQTNEWRLDTYRSIMGGMLYAKLLNERWSTPENEARIRELFKDPEVARTQLILASYNSGYARVQAALATHGKDWMAAPELGEARKYVNRIFSFCHFFAENSDGGAYASASQGF